MKTPHTMFKSRECFKLQEGDFDFGFPKKKPGEAELR